jgi:hypothetical protein
MSHSIESKNIFPHILPGPTKPPIQWVPGALSLGVKQLGHKADHSPPSSVRSKNTWSYTFTPQYIFMAWCIVKHRDNLLIFCQMLMITRNVEELNAADFKEIFILCHALTFGMIIHL